MNDCFVLPGERCRCGTWVTPAFQIQCNKVDLIRGVTAVAQPHSSGRDVTAVAQPHSSGRDVTALAQPHSSARDVTVVTNLHSSVTTVSGTADKTGSEAANATDSVR